MKVTKSYIKQLVKEELTKVLKEESTEADFDFRITNGSGEVPGLKPGTRGRSIMVRKKGGRGPTPEHKQIYVLPKSIGTYQNLESAIWDSYTGESYYMTPEEIEKFTIPDSVRPGQFANNISTEW